MKLISNLRLLTDRLALAAQGGSRKTPEIRKNSRRSRNQTESLETRALLAAVNWQGGAEGDWNVAANWDTNTVPTIDDDVTVNGATVAVDQSLLVRDLTLRNTTLDFTGGYSIGAHNIDIGVESAINAGENAFQIHGRYGGRSIGIGEWEPLSWQMNLTEEELNSVNTPHLTIGDDNDGWIPFRTTDGSAINLSSNPKHLTVTNNLHIQFHAAVELGEGQNLTAISHSLAASDGNARGIFVWEDALSNVGGDVTLESAQRIFVGGGGRIETGDHDITLRAHVAGASENEFNGVAISGQVRTTGTGSITIEGRGGNAADKQLQRGVMVDAGGVVESTAATNGGEINITGWGGAGTNINVGVDITGGASNGGTVESVSGAINIDGYGGGTGNTNIGVSLFGGLIQGTVDAPITVTGYGSGWSPDGTVSPTAGSNNDGIAISTNGRIASSGDATLLGYGAGGGGGSHGIHLGNDGHVQSIGSGTFTLTGIGAGYDVGHQAINNAGEDNDGVKLDSGALVEAVAGQIVIAGLGGEGSENNDGVDILDSEIVGEGSASITIQGNLTPGGVGVNSGGENFGVRISDSDTFSTEIRVDDGALNISGTGASSTGATANSNFGTYFGRRVDIFSAGSGDITVDGVGGTSSGRNSGVFIGDFFDDFGINDGDLEITGTAVHASSNSHGIETTQGEIIFNGNGDITLNGTSAAGSGVDLRGLNVRPPQWSTIADNAINIIGHTDAADGSDIPDVRLQTSGFGSGARVLGDYVFTAFRTSFNVDIGGIVPIIDHSQVITAEEIRLDGDIHVRLTDEFVPAPTDSFIIVDNQGDNPIVETFSDLPEGSLIPVSGGLEVNYFAISYVGGDGNDVVLYPTFTVTNTNDSGDGSLRQAMTLAAATPDPDTILFDIPGDGPHVIDITTALPAIDSYATRILGTYIDGERGLDDVPPIEIRGDRSTEGGSAIDGLKILSGDVFLTDLIVRNFSGHGIHATTHESHTVEASLDINAVTVGGNVGSGLHVDPSFGSVSLNTFQSGVTVDGLEADRNEGYGVHIVRDDGRVEDTEISFLRSVFSGNDRGGLLIDDQRTAAGGNVAYEFIFVTFGTDIDRGFAISNGNFGAKITQTGEAPLPAFPHKILSSTFSGNDGIGLWLENTREFSIDPTGGNSHFGLGNGNGLVPIPNKIGLKLTNASSISGDSEPFSGGGEGGSYYGGSSYYEGLSGTISGANIKHNTEIGLLIEADETLLNGRMDVVSTVVEDNERGVVINLGDDYEPEEGYQLNLQGLVNDNRSAGIEINGLGDNAEINTLVIADDNAGAGLLIGTDGPRVNVYNHVSVSEQIVGNAGPGIRHTGAGENLHLYRRPAADFGSGAFDPNEYSPQIFGNQGTAIDLAEAGPTPNTVHPDPNNDTIIEWFHPVIDTASLTEDGFLDITGRLGADAGFFLQFYATTPTLDGRGVLQTPLGNYAQLSSDPNLIPQDVLDALPEVPARIFDTDFDPERFRVRIEVGTDFNRGLLTAVVVDPTLGQATSDFMGVSELAPVVSIGTQLTALPPVLDVGSDERIFADDLFDRTVTFTDEDSIEFTLTVDYGTGDGPQPIEYRVADRSIFLEHDYPNVGDYLVTVQILDDTTPLRQIDIKTFTVTVENTPPDVRFNEFTVTKRVNEGETVDLTGFFDDLNIDDRHTVTIDWGDGNSSQQGPLDYSNGSEENTFDFTHTYLDDGASRADAHVYRVIATIVDEHGATVESPVFLIEVDNVLPEIEAGSIEHDSDNLDGSINEGESVTLSGSFIDIGLEDSHDVWIDWGDGSDRQRISINPTPDQLPLRTFEVSHTYTDNSPVGAPFEVTWTVEDDDAPGQVVPAGSLFVTVNNVAPVIENENVGRRLELNQVSLREGLTSVLFIPFVDPGTEARTATVNWGDGEVTIHNIEPGENSATVTHRYLQDSLSDSDEANDDYTILVTLNDGFADSDPETIGVSITDAAIMVGELTLDGTEIDEGELVTVSGTFSSDSPTDTYTVMIDWGNGHESRAQVDNTLGTFTATYRYDDGGNPDSDFTVQATVTNGLSSTSRSAADRVEVSNVAPTASLVPAAFTDDSEILLQADAFDPSTNDTENLTYTWTLTVGGAVTIASGPTFSVDPSDLSGPATVRLQVSDDDGGSSDPQTATFLIGDNSNDTLTVNTGHFAGTDTLIVAGLGGNDILDASGITDPTKSVILIGGTGDDTLFDGSGDDIILLAAGDDSLNLPGTGVLPNEGGDDLIYAIPNSTLTAYDSGGNNTLSFELANSSLTQTNGITFDLSQTVGNGVATPQDVAPNGSEPNEHFVAALGTFGTLIGSDYDDSLTGSSDSTVAGGSGADNLFAAVGSTNSTFAGGADDDILTVPTGTFGSLNFGGDDGLDSLLNAGTISELTFGGGADDDILTNSGSILMSLNFGGDDGADSLLNTGTIAGLTFGGGADDDILQNAGLGASIGTLNFGGDDGLDVLLNSGTLGTLTFDGGADDDIFINNGPTDTTLNFGGDDDILLSGSGSVTNLNFGGDDGLDILVNLGTVTGTLDFDGGADDDIFINAGAGTSTLNFGGDDDTLLSGMGTIANLNFGGDDGADVLLNTGTLTTLTFTGGADDDIFVNNGPTDTTLNFGGDDDVLLAGAGTVGDLNFGGDDGADILLNLGGVTGTLDFDGGADDDIFLNVGTEQSALNFGGDDEILLSGEGAVGVLNFGGDDGADVLLNTGMLTTLTFTGGADDDILVNNGMTATTLNFGGDDDILLAGFGSIGDLNFGGDDGFDTLLNLGIADNLTFTGGADDDILENTGTVTAGLNFGGDDGLDTLLNTGTIADLTFGGGADDDILRNTGDVTGTLNFGGDQQFDLNTRELIDNTTTGDDGLDALLNSGTITSLVFTGGADDDILQNAGTNASIGSLNFTGDDGNDVLQNSATITNLIFTGGADDDVLQNTGTVLASLNFEGDDGEDILINTASIASLTFTGGADDDTLITLGAVTWLTFNGGADDDVLQVQADSLTALDFNGDGGNDIFVNRTGSLASLTFNGGADDDILINRGSEIASLIFNGDDGNDSFVNSGDAPTNGSPVLEFNGGDGSNAFRNEGKNWDTVTYVGGNDADFFQNNGTDLGGVSFEGGIGFNAFENNADNVLDLRYDGTTGDDIFANDGNNVTNLVFNGDDGDNIFLNTGDRVSELAFNGGGGSDVFVNRGSQLNNATLDGAAGDDVFLNYGTSASAIEFIGGAGADRWLNKESARGASSLTFSAGIADDAADRFINDADSFNSVFLNFEGGVGDDQFINRGGYIGTTLIIGGPGNDIAFNSGEFVRDIELDGGEGDDTFENRGTQSFGRTFRLTGGAGNDLFLQNLGGAYAIEVLGGAGDDSLLNFSNDVNSLLLDGGDGHDILQNTGDDFETITVAGDAGEKTLHNFGDGGTLSLNLTGTDTAGDLINSGSNLTEIQVTTEGPTILISTGNSIDLVSVTTGDANDAVRITGKDIANVNIATGSGADSVQLDLESRDDTQITIATESGNDLVQLRGSLGTVTIDTGDGDDQFVYSATAAGVVLNGNIGNDSYQFAGTPAGAITVAEAFDSNADTSRDTLDFSAFTTDAISLDLELTTPQTLPTAGDIDFTLTLTDALGIEDVVGTTGADTILGNARDNLLHGARYTGSSGRDFGTPVDLTRTQWVLLDFATKTTAGELTYTPAMIDAIIQNVTQTYTGFDVQWVTTPDDLPDGIRDDPSQYVTIFFNSTPPSGRPGGQASEIDVGNVNLGGIADVQISGMVGGREVLFSGTEAAIEADGHEFQAPDVPKPAATAENVVALSSKLAAHELAHLLGMRHYDAYGPIGFGINAAPGHHDFTPDFPGPAAAFETADHIISSPASAGTDRFNDLRDLYFGQREAVKLALAFSDPAAVLQDAASETHRSFDTALDLQPVTLTVPNTAIRGLNQSASFQTQGIMVASSISLDPETGTSESDWYSFEGFAGDVVTIEVMSRALARYSDNAEGNLDHAGYIDSVLRLYDADENLVATYGQDAVNDDEFESSDSLLMDILLPTDGQYYIEVDTFARSPEDDSYDAAVALRDELEARNDLTPDEQQFLNRLIDSLNDTDTGSYDLVMYVSASVSETDGTDTLQGREGIDTFEAGEDDDYSLTANLSGDPASEPGVEWTGTVDLTDRGGHSWSGTIDFGDGDIPLDVLPGQTQIQYTFETSGIHIITVVITNDDGLTHTTTLEVNVTDNSVEITELDINAGLENRSAVKTADVVFSDATIFDDILASLADTDSENDRLKIERLQLNGESYSEPEYLTLPASAFTVSGTTLSIDFGVLGIQQNGVFAIRVDTDGDFDNGYEQQVRFHRLLGDVNGDGKVDRTDLLKTRRAYRRPANYADADVDGNGIVDRLDLRIFSSLARTGFRDKLLFDRDDLDD